MLEEIIDTWRGWDPLGRLLGKFDEMLEGAQWMFDEAWAVIEGEKNADAVRDALRLRDREINRLQREIRRGILEHLTREPDSNLPACLALMSIVKDAERLGDYSKNILDLGEVYHRPLGEAGYGEHLRRMREEVVEFFLLTRQAFEAGDEDLARQVVRRKAALSKEADRLLGRLLRDRLETADAVAYALLARHLKRISSHLANIASSVFAPLDAIDYGVAPNDPPGAAPPAED